MAPGRAKPHPQQEAGFRTLGMLRNRVGPPWSVRCYVSSGKEGDSFALARGAKAKGIARERRGQEAVGPKFGRLSASEAGVAVTRYIRPLVKVIISPNLLFCYAVAPADWPGDVRPDPGRTLWGQK